MCGAHRLGAQLREAFPELDGQPLDLSPNTIDMQRESTGLPPSLSDLPDKDTWRRAICDWHGDGTDGHIHEAMQAAHDIRNERLVAVAWYSRRGMAAGTLDTPENALAALQRSQQAALRRSQTVTARIKRMLGLPHGQLPNRLRGRYDRGRVTLRSWNGSYDADSATDVFKTDNRR